MFGTNETEAVKQFNLFWPELKQKRVGKSAAHPGSAGLFQKENKFPHHHRIP